MSLRLDAASTLSEMVDGIVAVGEPGKGEMFMTFDFQQTINAEQIGHDAIDRTVDVIRLTIPGRRATGACIAPVRLRLFRCRACSRAPPLQWETWLHRLACRA